MISFSIKENIDSVNKGITTLKVIIQQLLILPLSSRERAHSLRENEEVKCENWGGLAKQLLEIYLHLTEAKTCTLLT